MFGRIFRYLGQLDWPLLIAVAALSSFGLVAIYSLSLSREPGVFWSLKKQLIAIALGLVLILVMLRVHYKTFKYFTPHLYIFGLALLAGVLVFGQTIRGTRGWFALGSFNFQPVEFVKIAMLPVLARYFSAHARTPLRWKELFQSGALVLAPCILVMLEPDLGSALLIMGVWFFMMLFIGIDKRIFAICAAIAVIGGVVAWMSFAPYQKDRILTFLDPSRAPLAQGYNVIQAKIAIGSGGLFGRGIGFGSQSQLRFLPESMTDFIISVVGEELGFVGMLALILIFAFLFYRLYVIARRADDDFGALLVLGFLSLAFIQFTVNIGMNLSLLPVTGITLPFVSYGASSMLMSFLGLALVQSVAKLVDKDK